MTQSFKYIIIVNRDKHGAYLFCISTFNIKIGEIKMKNRVMAFVGGMIGMLIACLIVVSFDDNMDKKAAAETFEIPSTTNADIEESYNQPVREEFVDSEVEDFARSAGYSFKNGGLKMAGVKKQEKN